MKTKLVYIVSLFILCLPFETIKASATVPGKKHVSESEKEGNQGIRHLITWTSIPGLIHLYTADSADAHDSVSGATGALGLETAFSPGLNGLAFDFNGTKETLVSLPININSNNYPSVTCK